MKGFSLIEVLVAASIITVFLSALIGTHNTYLRASGLVPEKTKALFLAEEGIENTRFSRDMSWNNNIAPFSILPTQFIDGKYMRETTLSAIGDHSKAVRVSVSWSDHGATTTVSLSSLLTNLYDN